MDFPEKLPRVWIGLGNPGTQYGKTRHNAGYRALDILKKRFGATPETRSRHGKVWKGNVRGNEIYMMKPTTYMNLSGNAARWLLNREGLQPEDMVVFHDDMDLETGITKLKWKGGDAGHKGIRSIISSLRTNAFFRVRIGIGRPPAGEEASDYVLARFTPAEEETLHGSLSRIAEGMEIWADKGTIHVLNFLNPRE